MDENKRYGWGHLITLIAVVTVVWAALLLLTPVKAHADTQPYGGCKESVQVLDGASLHSEAVRYCRQHGWMIKRRLVINPFGEATTTLPGCRFEDDDRRCWWNALSVGNGRGHGFIALPGRTVYVDKINGHWATSKKKRVGYWITVPYGV